MASGESSWKSQYRKLTVLAPAKVNLVLEVLGKRQDGYHEIRSLIQTISLWDVLYFELAEEIYFECSEPSLSGEDNLVVKATSLVKEITGYPRGARIRLEKRIPWGVGLGGGSSDAGATLLALNQLWDLSLPVAKMVRLASQLGSDVPFFLYQGAAVVKGKGEKVKPQVALAMPWLVVLVPSLPRVPDKTKYLYSCLTPDHFTKGVFTRKAVKFLSRGKGFAPSLLFNVFEGVAFTAFPGLQEYRERFVEAGATNVCLAGSGPALFSLVGGEAIGKELYNRLYNQGLECYLVSTFFPEPGRYNG